MNIFLRELKTNAKSLIIWCLGMIFLIYAGMVKYSAFSKTGDAVNEFMSQIPDSMKTVLGIGNGTDVTSVAVFYSMFFLFFMLLAAVHSCMLGALIISKEERDKTADFLFVKPIRRSRAISSKILAAIINIAVLNAVTYAVSVISVEKHNTGSSLAVPVLMITSALFILQVLFLGVGLLFGALAKNSKVATSAATSIILGTFILKVIIDMNNDVKAIEFLSPFRYFKADEVMFDRSIDIGYVMVSAAVVLLCAAGTYIFFQKRDLRN